MSGKSISDPLDFTIFWEDKIPIMFQIPSDSDNVSHVFGTHWFHEFVCTTKQSAKPNKMFSYISVHGGTICKMPRFQFISGLRTSVAQM